MEKSLGDYASEESILSHLFLKILFLMFILETERDRQSMSEGGAEREGDTESEAGPRL